MELRAEIERLISENKLLSEQAEQGEKLKSELEQMKALIKERDLLLEGTNGSVKEVVGKSLEEVHVLRHVRDENEQAGLTLEAEVEALRAQCDNLKYSLYEDELEKEKIRKQVFQLKADLKKKDEAISSIEKTSKENNGQVVVHERSKTTSINTKSESKQCGSKEVITLKETIKLLESFGQTQVLLRCIVTFT